MRYELSQYPVFVVDITNSAGGPAVPWASGTTFLNQIPGIPRFSGSEHEKDTVIFEQWLHSFSDARRNFSGQ